MIDCLCTWLKKTKIENRACARIRSVWTVQCNFWWKWQKEEKDDWEKEMTIQQSLAQYLMCSEFENGKTSNIYY